MIAIEPSCVCGPVGEWSKVVLSEVRLCEVEGHHRYWKGDKELVSVSHVIRRVWPVKPNFMAAKPSVLANARHRGIVLDRLFSKYLARELHAIPIGTRLDSLQLFWRLKRWWSDHKHGACRSQVILADDDIAGTCDVLDEEKDAVFDVKAVSRLEVTYPLQLGAYGQLFYATFGRPVKKLGIIHLNKTLLQPKLIELDPAEVIQDWLLLRDTYMMAMRRMLR